MTRLTCPYGCGHAMWSPRRDGETDLDWWTRERGTGHSYKCPGQEAKTRRWNLDSYGIESIDGIEPVRRTVKITVELTLDTLSYDPDFMRRKLEASFGDGYGGVPHGINAGGWSFHVDHHKIKSIRFPKEKP